MELDITERNDGIAQVALVGRLDVSGLHEIDVKFHAATAARSLPSVVDLSRLDYIASLGMGMLISCAQSLQRKGKPMVLAGARGDVDNALRSAGIDQAITMVDDVDEAIGTLGVA